MEEWSAVVLAGGVGSRLSPLTTECPKPLVPVANKPMIDYNLELLERAGIRGKIVIITKYLEEEIRKYFDQIDHFKELDIVIPHVDPLDTADAVRKAANYIDTDNFIVSMADIITNISLKDFMSFHQEKKGIASITLKDVPHPRAFGVIILNQNSQILLFLEKPHPQELGLATLTFSSKETIRLQSNLVNTGIYAFRHRVLEILDRLNDLMDFGKHVFPYLAREYGIYGYARTDYYWMDAGNPQTYLYTNRDVLRRWSFPYFPKATWEENGIWWNGGKPQVPSSSQIHPPAAIGQSLVIGNSAIISGLSVIGDNVNIGDNTSINGSVIWNDVEIGKNVSIDDTIICNNVLIPDNSILATGTVIGPNLKFQKELITETNQILEKINGL
ncbi:MAG: NDP-sugar synthase [Candidatus Heimdallarchaeota archaeon]|nr:NDP-sugar synthase [Candidatus Heimdallarchaeota archaeon]